MRKEPDKKLPWSESTEQSLLGSVILRPGIISWLEVSHESFHDPNNRAIWQAMSTLHSRDIAIDEVTIEAELQQLGTLDAIGGLAYIAEVAIKVPTAANAESYASTLEQYRVSRDLRTVMADTMAKGASDGLAGEGLLDELLGSLAGIKRAKANEETAVSKTIKDLVRRMIEDVDSVAKGELGSSFISTGISALDAAIGGFPRGTVTAIGARPGHGKSSMLLNLADHSASQGLTVAIFTTEDPRDRWNERLIAKRSSLPVDRVFLRELSPSDLNEALSAADTLGELDNLHVIHAHGMNAQDIVRVSIGLGADVVGVDYIQKLKAPNIRMKLHEAIEASSMELGNYAGKSGASVIVLSQLSKEIEKEDRRPTMADLRYGEGLNNEAKLGLLLHDPKNNNRRMLREVLIAKRNQGRNFEMIEVLFDGAHCRFLEATSAMSQSEF